MVITLSKSLSFPHTAINPRHGKPAVAAISTAPSTGGEDQAGSRSAAFSGMSSCSFSTQRSGVPGPWPKDPSGFPADLALWFWIRFLRKEAMSQVVLWSVVSGAW